MMTADIFLTFTGISVLLLAGASVVEGACPSGIAGYSLTINLAVSDGDLSGPFTDVQAAINNCNTKADCKGVAGSGAVFMTKPGTMIPTSVSVGACVYAKLPTVCPPQPGYSVIADIDTQGTALGSPYPTIGSARSACEGSGDCLGFDGKSFTARSGIFPMVYSRGTCFYVKLPTSCRDVAGYIATPDVYITDTSIDVKKPSELPNCCNNNDKCTGFMSNGERKATSNNQVYRRGACWYKKNSGATSCPAIPGYTAKPDQDLASPILKTFSNSTAAAAGCFNDATCAGFTSNDWRTRSSGTKFIYWYGSCFYVKTDVNECATADPSVNCTNTPGSFNEVCASGYENYNAASRNCSDINECVKAGPSVNCTNTPGNFTEVCAPGYTNYDSNARTCSDINECSKADASVNCTNTPGNFTEVCATGYKNYDATNRTCSDVNECDKADVSVSCSNTVGNFTEVCASGYTNYNAATRNCSKLDKCASADVSVICINTAGGFTKQCANGYENYNNVTETCTDIDECATASKTVICTNTNGSFSEVCASGFSNYNISRRFCSEPCNNNVQGFTAKMDYDLPTSKLITWSNISSSMSNYDNCNLIGYCSSFTKRGISTALTTAELVSSPGSCTYVRNIIFPCDSNVGYYKVYKGVLPMRFWYNSTPVTATADAQSLCGSSCGGFTDDGRMLSTTIGLTTEPWHYYFTSGRCFYHFKTLTFG